MKNRPKGELEQRNKDKFVEETTEIYVMRLNLTEARKYHSISDEGIPLQ
jgi:hypothetical protein